MEKVDVIHKIESNLLSYTKLQRMVAHYVLDMPMDAAFSTVQDLSNKVNVSTATVVRFANSLGYSGYTEFQQDLQAYLQDTTNPVKRLEASLSFQSGQDSIIHQIHQSNMLMLNCMLTPALEEKIYLSADLISKAAHIYTFGAGGNYVIAYYLAHQLNRSLQCADPLPESSQLANYIVRINSNDVLITINLPRYNSKIFNGTKAAKERGARIITITDSVFSPYADISDALITLPFRSQDFHNSLMPALMVAEILISLVINKNRERTRNNLHAMEPISDILGTFLPGQK